MLDKNMEIDLITIMRDNAEKINTTYAEGTFAQLFWDEQFKAASLHNKRQVRWHPVIIKWCLNLKLLSSSAYHAFRSSEFVTLPSERTLQIISKISLVFKMRSISNYLMKFRRVFLNL